MPRGPQCGMTPSSLLGKQRWRGWPRKALGLRCACCSPRPLVLERACLILRRYLGTHLRRRAGPLSRIGLPLEVYVYS